MKTLDEVIKGFECCQNVECNECPYKILINDDTHVPCDQLEKDEDALHYLKEYKANREDPDGDHQQLKKARNLLWEFYQNDPLTWDELKTMEGKPVWVEQHHGDTKGWLLILRKCDDVVTCTTKHGNSFYLYKANYGEKWQAYRKERG